MQFRFFFHGDERAAGRWLQTIGQAQGFRLQGADGLWHAEEARGEGTGAFPLVAWYHLRMLGETEWEDPTSLFRVLQERQATPQQLLQSLGTGGVRLVPAWVTEMRDSLSVQLSLALPEGMIPQAACQQFRVHPLAYEAEQWLTIRPWGRGAGVIVETYPFHAGADVDVFFVLLRDFARRVPLAADRLGFRSLRAWLPLAVCRALLRQIRMAR